VELRDLGDPGLALPVKKLAAVLAAVTLIRLVVATTAPLAPDETYYWVWSHALAAGYLDHPPMVALWIRAGTILAGQTALGVRLLGPLAAFVASWMLFDAGRVLFPGTKAGVTAVLLLNATLLLGVGTVIMTPDSPLLFFWAATLWAVAHLAAGGPGRWWLAAGVFGGLALDSKYTALFLWLGIGLWVLLVPAVRPWLRRWQPWAACAIGFLLFAPVLAWNEAHGWVGFIKQGGRVKDWHPSRALGFLGELIGGQIGLATPLVWALCMAGLWVAGWRAVQRRQATWSLLAALSVPPALVFLQHVSGDRVQGNWPAIIYPALTIAAGALTVRRPFLIGAVGLGFAITALAYVQATTGLIPLPPRLDPIAMRLAGWDGLARQTQVFRDATGAAYVAADGYALASELAWWMPDGIPVVGTDERWRLTTLPVMQIAGKPGLLIRDARRTDAPDSAIWAEAERIGTLTRTRMPGGDFAVYRVTSAGNFAGLPAR
jgi:4-amino-4-deoxy-L-arabinose transferase-like glycosyltransferase